MDNHPYIKPGSVSLLLHSILILLIMLSGTPGYVAPVEEPETVEVEVEPARLIYAPPIVSEPETAAPEPAASGSPAPSIRPPVPNQPPAPDPAPPQPQLPQPEIPNPLPVLPNADPASNQPPALPGGSDENSVALPALIGGSGGLGTPGTGSRVYGVGSADGSGGGSGNGNGSGTGSGHGHGDGSGEGYSGPSGRYNPKPGYPSAARQAGHEGTVFLQIEIDEDGIPASVSVISGSGYDELDEAAANGVRKWRYSPAKRDGQPVASSKKVRVSFHLNDED